MRGMTVTNPELETAELRTIEGMAFWSGIRATESNVRQVHKLRLHGR